MKPPLEPFARPCPRVGDRLTRNRRPREEKRMMNMSYGRVRRWVSLFSGRIAVAKEVDQYDMK